MDTTTLDIDEYKIKSLQNLVLSSNTLEGEVFQYDVTDEFRFRIPLGPEVQFQVEEYDFDTLVCKLIEFERQYGLSSVEMFSQYIHGVISLDEDMEEWLDLFILYLGTYEVRQFSCP